MWTRKTLSFAHRNQRGSAGRVLLSFASVAFVVAYPLSRASLETRLLSIDAYESQNKAAERQTNSHRDFVCETIDWLENHSEFHVAQDTFFRVGGKNSNSLKPGLNHNMFDRYQCVDVERNSSSVIS